MSHESRRRNRRVNRRLEAIFRQAGLNFVVSSTTRDGKKLGLMDDNDFPPEISDRVQYGSRPAIVFFQLGAEGAEISSPPQAVAKQATGPEPIRYDEERPEILEFALKRVHEIREKASELGVENVELREIALTRPQPPIHLVQFRCEKGCRRLTDEDIQKILADPTVDKFWKSMVRCDLEVLPYYEWVGGIFSDECWRLVRYAGIRLLVDAFMPNDAVERLLGEPQPTGA